MAKLGTPVAAAAMTAGAREAGRTFSLLIRTRDEPIP
jgi:hypothetical protein